MTEVGFEGVVNRLAMIFDEIGAHPLSKDAFAHHVVANYLKGCGLRPDFKHSSGDTAGCWVITHACNSSVVFDARDVSAAFAGIRSGNIPRTCDDRLAVMRAMSGEGFRKVETKQCDKSIYGEALKSTASKPQPKTVSAADILGNVTRVMNDRAEQYDQKETGERSMQSAVKAFNAIRHTDLTDADGFLLMALLKAVRADTAVRDDAVVDSIHDGVAYLSLHGEALLKQKRPRGLV